jgi:hypothetical protein
MVDNLLYRRRLHMIDSTNNADMFIIPIKELKNKSTINICDKTEKYRVK